MLYLLKSSGMKQMYDQSTTTLEDPTDQKSASNVGFQKGAKNPVRHLPSRFKPQQLAKTTKEIQTETQSDRLINLRKELDRKSDEGDQVADEPEIRDIASKTHDMASAKKP